MDRITGAIIRHRKWIVALFLAAAAVGAALQLLVGVNYSMTDYLPKDAQSTKALAIMEAEFPEAIPNARVMADADTLPKALKYKELLKETEGVESVMWLDDAADIAKPLETLDSSIVEAYYRDGKALFSVAISGGMEVEAVDAIYEVIGEGGAVSGEAVNTATSQKLAKSESLNAMLVLIPLIILILLLSTGSWAEPLFFMLAIGVSVLISLGTNIFLGEISFVTQSISPILQLAVSLDYAIFLLHSFSQFRERGEDVPEAMRLAMKKSFPAVCASAATTMFGFVALIFMDFGIGSDLGLNLVKGIVLSFISVMVFLPALTVCLYRWIDKTGHKKLMPEFKRLGGIVNKLRIPCLILVLALAVPCYLAKEENEFTYGMGEFSPGSRSGDDVAAINEAFGKSTAIVLLVPRGAPAKELALSEEIEKLGLINSVTSYANTVGTAIPPEYLDAAIASQFYGKNFGRIIAYADTDEEGDEAFETVEQVQAAARKYYGGEVYSLGQSVNLYDIKNTVTSDNTRVNAIAIAAIAAVLLLAFKSVSFPILLLAVIETAIWINLAVPYFTGSAICFVGFLVINTVQLGATVDYAILFTDNYREFRTAAPPRKAVESAMRASFSSILISASILSAAGFCLYFTSSNTIVSQLGLLLGRGTLLSMLMVVFFLPAVLTLFDRVIAKTTLKANFYKEEQK